jgi:nucleoredoxin
MLVLVDGATGEVITTNGRAAVQNNPTGEGFPWKPRTLAEILAATELVDNTGASFSAAAKLQGKTVGIYFSAHWCPREFCFPSRQLLFVALIVLSPLSVT